MKQKTVLITGAARGIGYAAATLFAEAGYAVALLDRDAEALTEATPLGDILKLPLDVSAPDTGPKAVAAILDRWGRLDALINNAGVADFRPIAETDLATWRRVMETNLDGAFLMTQAARPALAKTGGAIVNIASISGLRASTLRSAYGTSKAAVIQLTRQQAAELGEDGIRVNCVAPGPVDTKLALAVHSPEIRAAYHDAIPLNRYGTEAEIAAPIVFLCSDAASYITGQTLAVDGGFEATGVGLPALRES